MIAKWLAFAVFAGSAVAMFLMVFFGFWTGRVRHSDSTSTYALKTDPVRFLLVVVAFSVLGGIFLYAAVHTAIELWNNYRPTNRFRRHRVAACCGWQSQRTSWRMRCVDHDAEQRHAPGLCDDVQNENWRSLARSR